LLLNKIEHFSKVSLIKFRNNSGAQIKRATKNLRP